MRDNFVITYELLDEMLDFGYPQITEEKVLSQYIKTSSNKLIDHSEKMDEISLTSVATSSVGWRPEGIKYPKNEIFLDVVEKLNILISGNGTVLSSEIVGCIKMNSQLSGMPECKLGLNDKALFELTGRTTKSKLIDLDDIKFHPCVKLPKFEAERIINFIPPDGKFELMSYRLSAIVKPLFSVECILENFTNSKIEYAVKVKSHFKSKTNANNVEVIIPVPMDANAPYFKTNTGSVKYTPDQEAMVWYIKSYPGEKEYIMKARFGFPSIQDEKRDNFKKLPVQVRFEIPYFTVSGIQVRYLKVEEKSNYHAYPWVRYISKNGQYHIRIF